MGGHEDGSACEPLLYEQIRQPATGVGVEPLPRFVEQQCVAASCGQCCLKTDSLPSASRQQAQWMDWREVRGGYAPEFLPTPCAHAWRKRVFAGKVTERAWTRLEASMDAASGRSDEAGGDS